MTERDLLSARQWAVHLLFQDKPPRDGDIPSAIVELLRDDHLWPDERIIDAATVLLGDPDTLPSQYGAVVDDFRREQLRKDILSFAETCWQETEEVRRATWNRLQNRASGDLVYTALLSELHPLIRDVDPCDALRGEERDLLNLSRIAAALPGRLSSDAKSRLLSDPEFRRSSMEGLEARLPPASRWIQRVLVPERCIDNRQNSEAWLADWVEQTRVEERPKASMPLVYKMLIGAAIGNALIGVMKLFSQDSHRIPVGQMTTRQHEDLQKGLKRAIQQVEAEKKAHDKRRRIATTISKPVDSWPSDDRPPAPPVAVPLVHDLKRR